MNKTVEADLTDLVAIFEDILARLPKMTLAQRIDVAARLNGANKTIKKIDEAVKDEIKTKRRSKKGYVNGEIFKAYLDIIPTTRLDQKLLKAAEPAIFDKYNKTAPQERITFEPR